MLESPVMFRLMEATSNAGPDCAGGAPVAITMNDADRCINESGRMARSGLILNLLPLAQWHDDDERRMAGEECGAL
jgi:hypothetical protein